MRTFTAEQTFQIPVNELNTLYANNNKGGIIVTGWSHDNAIRVYLYKTVKASSQKVADDNFNNFKCDTSRQANNFQISISNPYNTDEITYKSCSLALDIPYHSNCNVVNAEGPIFIDQLNSYIVVQNAAKDVTVDHLVGSCEINVEASIEVTANLPNDGNCVLSSVFGDVILSIPDSTVSLETIAGSITHENLVFDDLNENEHTLQGVLGDGSAAISVHSDKGNIMLYGIE